MMIDVILNILGLFIGYIVLNW